MPHQVVIGPKGAAGELVSVRLRDGRRLDAQPGEGVLSRVTALVAERRLEESHATSPALA